MEISDYPYVFAHCTPIRIECIFQVSPGSVELRFIRLA